MDIEVEKRLVVRVISRMNFTSEVAIRDMNATKVKVKEALDILAPFKPKPVIEAMMTNFLCVNNADKNTCLSAWALFLDYRSFEEAGVNAA